MISQTDHESHAKGIMLRTEKYKYVSRVLGKDELYDLEKDPKEINNIIDDPNIKDVVVDLRYKMLKWLEYSSDIVPFKYDTRWTKESMYNKVKGIIKQGQESKVRALINEGADLFTVINVALGKE